VSFTVYRSSAGSGKTFVLVKEYLKIILQEPETFRHILAITFTNKAANEMKGRVLGTLKSLSESLNSKINTSSSDLLRQLVKETNLTESEIASRSEEVLKKILHHYSDFAIGTIDSFFHRIIRTFAHDFGLPVNFTVELDSDELLTTAVDLLFDRLGENPDLTKLLENFVESRMDDDKGWNIEKILTGFAGNLLDERAQEHLPKLKNISLGDFNRIVSSIYTRIISFENTIRELALKANDLILQQDIPQTSFSYGKNGISGFFSRLAAGDMERITPNSYVLKTIEEDKWTSGKATSYEKGLIIRIVPTLTEIFNSIKVKCDKDYSGYMLLKLLARSIYPLAVLNEIEKLLSEFKQQNNIIHISEFNLRIARLILGEPVPFIYERLGEKYHHLLIDEFQDTSALQWQNFIPLLENSLSQGYFNLVVGDGKQAIYRWRNGDVEQFTRLPKLSPNESNPVVREQEKSFIRHFEEKRLQRNYRSGNEIVHFNNEFFTLLSRLLDPPGQQVYRDLLQEADVKRQGGYIRIQFLTEDKGSGSLPALNRQQILEIINENRKDGYNLSGQAILCRTNKEASEIARFLAEKQIEVISSESLLLIHSSKITFLIALIRFITNPDAILLAEICTFLFRHSMIIGKEYHELMCSIGSSSEPDKLLYHILSENGIILRQGYLQTLPVYDLCEELIRLFSLDGNPDPYSQFFLDTVLKFTNKHSTGVSDFLDWWDKHNHKLSVSVPEGIDAIRIMTIHKAKGLQFTVVIFPFANEILRLTNKFIWVDLTGNEVPGLPAAMLPSGKDMEETEFAALHRAEEQKSLIDMINLLYVVMTRAEERLFILTTKPSKTPGKPQSVPSFFLWYLTEKGMWREDQPVYSFGKKTLLSIPENKRASTKFQIGRIVTGDWRKKIFIRSKAPEIWNVDDPDRSRQHGNLLHTILSGIRTADDLDMVLENMRYNGLLGDENLSGIKDTMTSLLSNPEIEPFFKQGLNLKTESEILLTDGTVLRPDRVIVAGDTAMVIDYKSGRSSQKYRNQLAKYEKGLRELGFREVRKYLLYLEPEVRLEEC